MKDEFVTCLTERLFDNVIKQTIARRRIANGRHKNTKQSQVTPDQAYGYGHGFVSMWHECEYVL